LTGFSLKKRSGRFKKWGCPIPYLNLVQPVVSQGGLDAVVNRLGVPAWTVLLEQFEEFSQDDLWRGGRARRSLLETPAEDGYGSTFAVQETSNNIDAPTTRFSSPNWMQGGLDAASSEVISEMESLEAIYQGLKEKIREESGKVT
jgi:hypothetical protein